MKLALNATVAGLVAGAALVLPGTAAAALLPTQTIAPSSDPNGHPAVQLSPGGAMVTAYTDEQSTVRAAYRPAGGTLDTDAVESSGMAGTGNERAAINDAGDAIVVFEADVPGDSYTRVYAVSRSADDGAWSAPQRISDTDNNEGLTPDVAIDDDGNAIIVFSSGHNGGSVRSVFRHADGTLEASQLITGDGGATMYGSWPRVALDGAGRATVGFANQSVTVATRGAGPAGAYAPATVVDTGSYYYINEVMVEANAAGDAVVGWVQRLDSWETELRTVHRDALGLGFGTKKTVGGNYDWGQGPTGIGLDADGDAVALWFGQGLSPEAEGTEGAFYDSATGSWTTDTSVNQALSPWDMQVAVGENGEAVAAWYEGVNPGRIKTMRRSPGQTGTWSTPETLSDTGAYSVGRARVGVDDDGSAAVLWMNQHGNNDPRMLQFRFDDRGAPEEESVDVPATAQLGEPVEMSAAFGDRYAGVTVDWDFGDGSDEGTGEDVEHTYDELGQQTVTITATDAAGNAADPVEATIEVVDTTAPETQITTAPDAATNDEPVTLAFTGTDNSGGALTFECAVDAAAAVPCSSPQEFPGLTEGAHTITVAAKDAAGNVDTSPATASFVVDRDAPETTITEAPDGPTTANPAAVVFESDEDGSTFECSLNGGDFESCGSPAEFDDLTDGSYDFAVRATDDAGNVDQTPAETTIVIDRTGPGTSITGGPAENGRTNAQPVVFGFSSGEAGDRDPDCMIGTSPVSCANGSASIPLSESTYTFKVRTYDALGNAGAWATRTFTVDRTAPAPSITSPANGSETTDTTLTLTGKGGRASGDDPAVAYGLWAGDDLMEEPIAHGDATVSSAGTWSAALPELELGTYTALVCQYDAAINYLHPCPQVTFEVVAPPKPDTGKKDETASAPVQPAAPAAGQQPTGGQATPLAGGGTTPKPKPTVGQAIAQGAAAYTGVFGKLGIPGLLARPVQLPFEAPGPGKAQVDLLAPTAKASAAAAKKRKKVKPTVVATGAKVVSAAGTTQIKVKLTAKGRKLLKRAKSVRLTLKTSFAPKGGKVTSVTRKVTLKK